MKNSTRNRFGINFIDIILIIVIAVAAVILVKLFTSDDINKSEVAGNTEIVYKIQVRNMREEFRNLVNVGDKVIDSVRLYTIGEVVDISYTDSIFTGTNLSDGSLVYGEYPGQTDMTLTIKASANKTDGKYMIGGYDIAVGSSVPFRVPHFTGTAYCISIEPQE